MVRSTIKMVGVIEVNKAGYMLLKTECFRRRTKVDMSLEAKRKCETYFDKTYTSGWMDVYHGDFGFTYNEAKKLLTAKGIEFKDCGEREEILLGI
jgi:hypothetical protein